MSLLRLVSSSSHDMMEHVHRKFVEGKKIPFQVQVYKSSSDDRTEPILIAPSRNAIGQLERLHWIQTRRLKFSKCIVYKSIFL